VGSLPKVSARDFGAPKSSDRDLSEQKFGDRLGAPIGSAGDLEHQNLVLQIKGHYLASSPLFSLA